MNTPSPHLEVKDLLVKRGGVPVLDIPSLILVTPFFLSLIASLGSIRKGNYSTAYFIFLLSRFAFEIYYSNQII